MKIRMMVACEGAIGPNLFPCVVECTSEEREEGEHYEVAKNAASLQGYDSPMVAFDEGDMIIAAGGKAMLDNFEWDTATTFSSDEWLSHFSVE